MERRLEACILVLGNAVVLQWQAQSYAELVKAKWDEAGLLQSNADIDCFACHFTCIL